MSKFPVDASKQKVVKTFQKLGFRIVREKEHISMIRLNSDGTKTPLTMPNHIIIKTSTLRAICTQSGISREEFLRAFEEV
ncbi:MAG: type II toxin-antitoxin system HicA family toxin [Bacteroidetes bacterium]|nr:type II toxin-antitoxin system HicA family toxin [Bacteroidota bacterium]MCL6100457.1 type II toxin-antitoxin system HicA family toxin [Bacteroidota bacterium]